MAQIAAMLPDWTLAPVVAAAVRTFERRQHQTRRHYQGGQRRRPSAVDRSGVELSLAGAGQPRVAAAPGGTTQANPRDRLEGATRLCARYRRLARAGKPANIVTTAIARDLAGFVWAIARDLAGFVWAIARSMPPAAG